MLWIYRKFRCSTKPEFVEELEMVFSIFGVHHTGKRYHSQTVRGHEFRRCHFVDCSILEKDFVEFVEKLKTIDADVSLYY